MKKLLLILCLIPILSFPQKWFDPILNYEMLKENLQEKTISENNRGNKVIFNEQKRDDGTTVIIINDQFTLEGYEFTKSGFCKRLVVYPIGEHKKEVVKIHIEAFNKKCVIFDSITWNCYLKDSTREHPDTIVKMDKYNGDIVFAITSPLSLQSIELFEKN